MKKTPLLGKIIHLAIVAAVVVGGSDSVFAASWTGNTSVNLNLASNWDALPANGDPWIFGTTSPAGTTLNNDFSGYSVSSITFAASALSYTLNGNAITLAGGITNSSSVAQTIGLNMALTTTPTITTGTGGVTLSGNISGAFGLTKSNAAGTLTLSGNNTFTGPVTVNRGTLSVSSLNSVVGGTASSNLGAPTTVSNGTISLGTGSQTAALTYTGTGETTDRAIAITGTIAVLDQSGASGLLKYTSNLVNTAATPKTLRLQGSTAGTGEFAGVIANGTGGGITSVTKEGTGTWTLSGNNTYTGNTTISSGGGTLSVSSDSNLGAGTHVIINQNGALQTTASFSTSKGIVASGGSPTINVSSGTFTLNGAITSTAVETNPLRKNGAGTLVLNSGSNSYSAGSVFLLAGGGLSLGHAAALNGTSLKINSAGSSLDNTTGASMAPTGLAGFQMTTGFTFTGTNNLDLSGAETGFVQTANSTRTITVTANTLTLGGIGTTGNFTAASATAKVDGALTKSGAGTLALVGTSTYTGATTVTAGTLLLSSTATIASSTIGFGVTDSSNGLLTAENVAFSFNGVLSLNINAVTQGTANWTLINGSAFGAGDLNLSSITSDIAGLTFTNDGFGVWTGTDTNSRTWTFQEDLGTLSVIPEPATWALLAAGLTVTMVLRRRRNA